MSPKTLTPPELESYLLVKHPQPHPGRALEILRNHPDVRHLIGPGRLSVLLIFALVALQLAIAWLLLGQSLLVSALAGFFIGAYIDHALWVLAHECAHGLVVRSPTGNRLLAILINLPFMIPSVISFCIYHLKHHTYLGHTQHDADIAPRWEARLLRGGFFSRLLWMALYPLTQGMRSFSQPRGREPRSWQRWIWPNIIAVVVFDLIWFWLAGSYSFRYLVASVFFSIGPHPLGARWIQEHSVFRPGQETYSYYGPLNVVSLNIGYHNEHHDLPMVAWYRLPRLKKLAPEMYDHLYYHRSMFGLWLRFLFDREYRMFRFGRKEQYATKAERPTTAGDTSHESDPAEIAAVEHVAS